MDAIKHMNDDHLDIVISLCKHFGNFQNPQNVKLISMNENEMVINCDEGEVKVPFLSPANQNGEGFRGAIMQLIKSLNLQNNFEKISSDMVEFIDSFNSVIISSDLGERCIASYAPFIRKNSEFYILISDVPVHFNSITKNPEKIQIMFLQDEKEAATIFARRRVSFDAKATLRDDIRKEILQDFEVKFGKEPAFATIKNMIDFHIVKIEISKGRLVNGFGAAYDTDGFKVLARVGGAMPHRKK